MVYNIVIQNGDKFYVINFGNCFVIEIDSIVIFVFNLVVLDVVVCEMLYK